jgi:hypothetical protein
MFKKLAITSAVFVGAALISASSQAAGMQLSQAECDSLWNQANPSSSQTLSQSQAQPYVTDFKKVDTDNDGTISKTEFQTGCNQGFVKSSSSSGSSSGSNGQ